MLCRFEALERFSVQYRPGDPEFHTPLGILGTSSLPKPSHTLLLGHPDKPPDEPAADSRGCSIGVDVFDAAGRAILELVEHEVVEAWLNETLTASAEIVELESTDGLRDIVTWLDGFGRQMRAIHFIHPSGTNIVIAICSDRKGARPVIGSAAGMDPAMALAHACTEAVVSWRNLMAIDMNGIMEDSLPPLHRRGLRLFRGQEDLASIEADGAVRDPTVLCPDRNGPTDSRSRLADLVEAFDREVALFDLTRPETAVPTVRAVLDSPVTARPAR